MYSLIILAGGFGTRLKSISNGIPKSLMPIGDSVYLDIVLKKIFEHKIERVILSLYFKAELFDTFIKQSRFSNKITRIVEPQPLGTGGAVKFVLKNTKLTNPFFVINGDSLSKINLNKMVEIFKTKKQKSMIGVSNVKDGSRYGSIKIENNNVVSFNEKRVAGPCPINNGYYIFNKQAFEGYEGIFSIEKDLFPNLIKDNQLGSFLVNNDDFIDMGIPDDYKKLCKRYEVKNGI